MDEMGAEVGVEAGFSGRPTGTWLVFLRLLCVPSAFSTLLPLACSVCVGLSHGTRAQQASGHTSTSCCCLGTTCGLL